MRMKCSYLIIAFLAAGSMPANAAELGNTTAGKQAPTKRVAADKEKKVCKLLETSGTRFTERVCLTKAQWKEIESKG